MAQFDIYRNTGRQYRLLSWFNRHFMTITGADVPLVRRSTLTDSDVLNSSRMNPLFTVDEMRLYCIRWKLFQLVWISWVTRLAHLPVKAIALPMHWMNC